MHTATGTQIRNKITDPADIEDGGRYQVFSAIDLVMVHKANTVSGRYARRHVGKMAQPSQPDYKIWAARVD